MATTRKKSAKAGVKARTGTPTATAKAAGKKKAPAPKKAAAKKKVAPAKKAAAKKKAVPAKKAAAKKKAAPAKKAAATKKAAPAKKTVAKKKAAPAKKTVAKKKAVAPKAELARKPAVPAAKAAPAARPVDIRIRVTRSVLPREPMPRVPDAFEIATEDPRLRHAGQVASERARFDLGPQGKVIGERLGTLPPGYELNFVRGLIRDPNHLVAVWDINDETAIAAAESIGWDRVGLRVLDESHHVLVQVLVGARGGTHHLRVGRPGRTVRLAVGLDRPDGFFLTLARSAPVRMPADAPAGTFEPFQEIRLPARLDRRYLLRSEPPARPGQRGAGRSSPASRLHERMLMALRMLPGDFWITKDHELWRLFAMSEATRERAAEAWPEEFREAGAEQSPGAGRGEAAPGESITSPAGWSASGPAEEVPTSPGRWLADRGDDRRPTSPGRWLSGAGRDDDSRRDET